jgi:predicted RND superfamily exporter protein
LAILLSGLTVMIGFGSMVMLDFQPIRNFGVFTAFGDLIGVLAALYVLPALLMLGKPQKKVRKVVSEDEKHDVLAHLLHGLKAFGRKHPGRVLVLVGLGTLLVGGGALLVKSDLDELSFFQQNDTIRVADRLMNEKMAGTKALEVILDSDTRDPLARQGNPDQLVSLATPAVLKKLDQFSVDVRAKFPQVQKVNSYSDVLKKMNQVMNGGEAKFYAIPDDEALVAQYLEIFSGDTKALMTSNRDKLRIMVSMNSGTQDEIHQIALYAQSYFDQAFREANHFQVQVAGAQAITYVANQTLNKGNLESITACLIIVFVLLVVVLRNVRMTLIAVIPIVLCLAVNFGYMGYTGMPLNTATSLVSSIGIGIGIDFSIHFITWYRRELLVDRNILAAVDRTILHKGRAILYNLFVIVGGFLVLVGSSMGPMRDFGLLTALCLTVTAAGSLVVVPAVIRLLAKGNHKFLYLGVNEVVPRAMETE